MKKYINHKKVQTKQLFRIDNAGTGLVCLSRKVCEFMYNKYTKEPFESRQIVYMLQENDEWAEFGYNTL